MRGKLIGGIAFSLALFVQVSASHGQQSPGRPSGATATESGAVSGSTSRRNSSVVRLATGDVLGSYFVIGGRLCEIINEALPPIGADCVVRPSSGSRDNIEALRAGRVDLAIVQSDWQYQAAEGLGEYDQAGNFGDMRALFSLNALSATLVVQAGRGVTNFDKLLGKKVNIGPPQSNDNRLFRQLMAAMGWTASDFAQLIEQPTATSQEAYCAGQLDAMFFFSGHPSSTVAHLLEKCDSVLAPVDSPFIGGLASEFGYMAFSDIRSGELYKKSPETVKSIGLRLVVVTTRLLPDTLAQGVTAAVLTDLPRLQSLGATMGDLHPEFMASHGITVPLHDGAIAAYLAAQVPLTQVGPKQ